MNWTSYVISDLIVTIAMGIVAFTCLGYYFKTKYPHQLYLSLVWVWATIANFFWTTANLFLSKPLLMADMLCIPIEAFFTILLTDYITRDSIDTWKIFPFAILTGAFGITIFDPNNYLIAQYPDGAWALFYNYSITGTLFSILSLYWAAIFFYLYGKVLKEAPKYLKGKAFLNVFGMFLIAFRGILFEPLNQIAPILNAPILVIGVSLQVFTFIKYPQLAFTLAKKVIKLSVIDTKSGMSVFLHDWIDLNPDGTSNQARFSGLVFGINLHLQDILKRGNVDKIDLEHGVLLLERVPNSPWTVVLAATGTQLVLRRALKIFTEQFVRKYTQKYETIIEMDSFKSAIDLVDKYFPFVPDFKANPRLQLIQ